MKRYIFICSGNTCRSPMAEGIFKKLLAEKGMDAEVLSAGISTLDGMPPSENAVKAAAKYGADISSHRSRMLRSDMMKDGTVYLCMTRTHSAILKSAGIDDESIRVLDVSDPYGGDEDVYENCAEEIYEKLKAFAEEIE